jgi:hypothetical protein
MKYATSRYAIADECLQLYYRFIETKIGAIDEFMGSAFEEICCSPRRCCLGNIHPHPDLAGSRFTRCIARGETHAAHEIDPRFRRSTIHSDSGNGGDRAASEGIPGGDDDTYG